jgi:hypothetical protein
MGKVYRPGEEPIPGDQAPSALAIGDSWFWYINQTLLLALVNHPRVSADHAAIRLLGYNGARLSQYIGSGKFAGDIRLQLKPGFREGYSEFYISGFGNDAVDHAFALLDNCKGIDNPARCVSTAKLDTLLHTVSEGLTSLIHTIHWAYRDTNKLPPIFLNGYDYVVPDGRGVSGANGGWIAKVMDRVGVDPDLEFRKRVVAYVLNAMNDDVLAELHSPGKHVYHINARGTLSTRPADYKRDWENELHPTSEGFRKILEKAWFPSLRSFGIVRTADDRRASPTGRETMRLIGR